MPIDQDGLFAGRVQPIRVDDRVPGGRHDLDVFHAKPLQLARHPFGGPLHIGLVLGQGGNAGYGNKFLQFSQVALRLGAGVLDRTVWIRH